MKEKNIFMKNYKIIIGIIIGIILSSIGAYAATTIAGNNITYSNSKSGLNSTNVQGAIDELYEKADIGKSLSKAGKFVAAYTYSESGANKCIIGEESTCKKTTCYQTKTAGSCPAGTIILYKVNNNNIGWFNVLVDKGSTMTMQSQKNIINSIEWVKKGDYVSAGGTESAYGSYGNSNKGPITVLTALENATLSWNNVNNQTYSLGTNTGCSAYNSCTANTYTLGSRTAKARMITLQEAVSQGCTSSSNSCKKFMTVNESYWTSSAISSYSHSAWYVHSNGYVYDNSVNSTYGSRAVVEVSK